MSNQDVILDVWAVVNAVTEVRRQAVKNDADDDYQYDRTNPPASKGMTEHRKAMALKAMHCLSFQPQTWTEELCRTCGGPRYAHRPHALREKAS